MEQLYDAVIVGGGPAGLTAALYLARARYRVLVLEKDRFGGQIAITEEVVNYPGIAKTSGQALTDTMKQQAEHFGAEFRLEEATEFVLEGEIKTVITRQNRWRCLAVLLATGAHPRPVGFDGEETYRGRGVAYCATCDGEFFTGKEIFVVGGGYAAAEESVFLTKFARHVTILLRKSDFSCAASVAERAKNHENITVLTNTVLEEVAGENGLTYARYRNTLTGETTEYHSEPGDSFGVFVLAGYAPATEQLAAQIELTEQGYIQTDENARTNVPGVYAAGDVCVKPLRQIVTATGDGALAATEMERYLAEVQARTGLSPSQTHSQAREKSAPVSPETLFAPEMQTQLETLFGQMSGSLMLKLYLDNQPLSTELKTFAEDLATMTDKLTVVEETEPISESPCICICRTDGTPLGMAFHGVPGGHEFTSFVLGLYHVAGPGQPLEDTLRQRIKAIQRPVRLQVLVTLGCSMCPETVLAALRIAAENPLVTADIYDVSHFETLRRQYQVMSVPCLVIDGEKVFFGRKSLAQVLECIETV